MDFELDVDWETFKSQSAATANACGGGGGGGDSNGSSNGSSNGANAAAAAAAPASGYPIQFQATTRDCAHHLNAPTPTPDQSQSPKSTRCCSPIYISTTTKIAYLNTPVDIQSVFWEIPIIKYTDECEGVIKKQIKFSTTDRDDYRAVMDRISKERYADNQEIEHIDNPEGRIKFKDQRKISIGMSKKDILCYRSKRKRAFFNCFVIILRIHDNVNDRYSEMHVKVFNTGKLEIPGIQTNGMLVTVLEMVVTILRQFVGPGLSCIPGKCDTVLINSNFNCGFYINRDKLHDLLKYKYRINSNYDSCSYPGIQSKFYYINTNTPPGSENDTGDKEEQRIVQSGQQPANGIEYYEISFMIFRTGSVLIVGKCTEPILYVIYDFIKNILESEYTHIVNDISAEAVTASHKKTAAAKVQRRTIIVTSTVE